MCGIAGIVSTVPVNRRAVLAMNEIQRHRGPDGVGVWSSVGGRCVLGHRRLAIIDLTECARQPMQAPELGLTITYNGEIYNYIELRDRLKGLGHAFNSQSDTEVLLRAYAQWGPACLSELNGMFAFAIWDERRQEVFCARDRFGEKPFVYGFTENAFVFASEAKAVALVEGIDVAIDDGVLAAHADGEGELFDAFERTLIRGIRQLLPAWCMRVAIEGGRLVIREKRQYWSVSVHARHSYGTDAPERASREFMELLADSVRLRLRSDVAVGSCLSGGLDSSTVVALIRQLDTKREIRTFTGRFPGHALDEGHYAGLVSAAARTIGREVDPLPDRFEREAGRFFWHADFPVGGMSQFAQWCVFGLARDSSVTVLLDGQGSDEVLGGYGSSITSSFVSQLLAERRWLAWWKELRWAARPHPELFSFVRLMSNLPGLRVAKAALRRQSATRGQLARGDLYHGDWLASARRLKPDIDGSVDPRRSLSGRLWELSFRTMLSSLLRFGDRLSMAHSLEVRLPFCDHRIAEFCFGLSPDLLMGQGQVKRVLRLGIRGLVPDEIVHRRKQGFIPPQEDWLTGPLSSWAQRLTLDPGPIGGQLDMAKVRRLLGSDVGERTREAGRVWEVCNLLAWSQFWLARSHQTARHRGTLQCDPEYRSHGSSPATLP
ncbi:asparagine synthase (glutamine-hydrolyzing) [Myxococcota bacterium]